MRPRRNQSSKPYFTAETRSSQRSEYFLIKTLLLCALSVSAVRYPNSYLPQRHAISTIQRQRHREDRSFTHFALNSDLSTQKIHELLDNGESQTRASIFLSGRRIPSVKFLEDLDPDPSFGMPIPVSDTANFNDPFCCDAEILISPRSVNFTALPKRLRMICLSFSRSVFKAGMPGAISRTMSNTATVQGRFDG